MSASTTLYRFHIELSDVERGLYETLDIRLARHPSETLPYLLTRLFAFALNTQPGLEFSPGGLSDPDAPGLSIPNPQGGYSLWIEIGNPSSRKLHKAAKGSKLVKVYTYKDPAPWFREMQNERVHRKEEIEVFSLAPGFLDRLASHLEKTNQWALLHNDGALTVTCGDMTEICELQRHAMVEG